MKLANNTKLNYSYILTSLLFSLAIVSCSPKPATGPSEEPTGVDFYTHENTVEVTHKIGSSPCHKS